jgi:hypothetical protein
MPDNLSRVLQEILNGDALGMAGAARKAPRGDGPSRSPITAWRWATEGLVAKDGRRVRLENAKVAGRLLTSLAALKRFFAALNREPMSQSVDPTPRTQPERRRSVATAQRRLATASAWT